MKLTCICASGLGLVLNEYLKNFLERGAWLRHVFADRGCAGLKLKGAIKKIGAFTQEIGLISGETLRC
ncbi:MAG: hypothetical protein E5V74_05250, partial [Mesorhizobium sp.]